MAVKKTGRPKSEVRKSPITLSVDPETKGKIEVLAESMMIPPTTLIRWSIDGLIEIAETPLGIPVKIPKHFTLTRTACQDNPEYFI